jgi:hypothetical protein
MNTAAREQEKLDRRLDAWQANFEALVTWVETFGRNPQRRGVSEEEYRLYLWRLAQQVSGSDERKALLDAAVPGWTGKPRRKRRDSWDDAAQEFLTWVDSNGGKLPVLCDDVDEKRMYFWLTNQRQSIAAFPERVRFMDENIPGWKVTPPDKAWENRFTVFVEFVEKEGRLPKRVPEEQSLYTWLFNQKSSKDAGKLARLDAVSPYWRDARALNWKTSLDETVCFVNSYSRFPSRGSEDVIERRLGIWFVNQLKSARGTKGPALSEERKAQMDEFLPGWAQSC